MAETNVIIDLVKKSNNNKSLQVLTLVLAPLCRGQKRQSRRADDPENKCRNEVCLRADLP
jgi:hypothetical protein